MFLISTVVVVLLKPLFTYLLAYRLFYLVSLSLWQPLSWQWSCHRRLMLTVCVTLVWLWWQNVTKHHCKFSCSVIMQQECPCFFLLPQLVQWCNTSDMFHHSLTAMYHKGTIVCMWEIYAIFENLPWRNWCNFNLCIFVSQSIFNSNQWWPVHVKEAQRVLHCIHSLAEDVIAWTGIACELWDHLQIWSTTYLYSSK